MVSITDFIKKFFSDEIINSSREYVLEHARAWAGEDVFDDILVNEVQIQNVYAGYREYPILDIDILASVSYSEFYSDFGDIVSNLKWLRLTGLLILSKTYPYFEIYNVAVYKKGSKNLFENKLSDQLLPLISNKNSEEYAKFFLKKYYPEMLDNVSRLDIDVLLDRMSLQIDKKRLASLGRIYFMDNTIEGITSGTIVLNKYHTFFRRNSKSSNNTIVHECVHWEFARFFFDLLKFLKWDSNYFDYDEPASVDDKNLIGLIEWQANELTPKILMPKETTEIKTGELVGQYYEENGNKDKFLSEYLIEEISEFFGVSKQSAQIRLAELGFEEVLGAYNYIDGEKVPTHKWLKGFLNRNQTFSISQDDCKQILNDNRILRDLFFSKKIIFVESHLCLADEKYITKNKENKLELTPYAREHMEECCFVFEINYSSSYDSHDYTFSYLLNREKGKVKYNINFSEDSNKQIFSSIEAVTSIIKNFPNDFGEALIYLMKNFGITAEELSEKSKISSTSISRLRTNKSEPKLETIIAICIGMSLPYKLSWRLIDTTGRVLRDTDALEYLYIEFLINSEELDVTKCNELLEERGYPRLTKNNE